MSRRRKVGVPDKVYAFVVQWRETDKYLACNHNVCDCAVCVSIAGIFHKEISLYLLGLKSFQLLIELSRVFCWKTPDKSSHFLAVTQVKLSHLLAVTRWVIYQSGLESSQVTKNCDLSRTRVESWTRVTTTLHKACANMLEQGFTIGIYM